MREGERSGVEMGGQGMLMVVTGANVDVVLHEGTASLPRCWFAINVRSLTRISRTHIHK